METTQLQVSLSVKSTDTPDGVVLLDIEGGMTFPLDAVGTIIWKGLEQHLSIEAITQQIADTYQIPIKQALADVQEFVQQLRGQHLVHGDSENESAGTAGWLSIIGRACRRLTRRHRNAAVSDRVTH